MFVEVEGEESFGEEVLEHDLLVVMEEVVVVWSERVLRVMKKEVTGCLRKAILLVVLSPVLFPVYF